MQAIHYVKDINRKGRHAVEWIKRELDEILKLHQDWLKDIDGGKEANLYADLYVANLSAA